MEFKEIKGKYKVKKLSLTDTLILVGVGVLGTLYGGLLFGILFIIIGYFIEKHYQLKKTMKGKK